MGYPTIDKFDIKFIERTKQNVSEFDKTNKFTHLINSLVGLIFVFKTIYIAPVSVAFALFIDVLECLVAFLQAYVFTMLTALFIGSAVADHNEDGAHTTDDDHATAGH